MTQEITTAEAYRSKRESESRKEVVLPSGAAFIIRKISSRELVEKGLETPVKRSQDIILEANNAEAWSRLTDEQKKEQLTKTQERWQNLTAQQKKDQMIFNDQLISLGTVSPKLTAGEASADVLSVHEFDDDDYYALLKEISEFSWGKKVNEFFRTEPERAQTDAGRSGQEISPATDAAPGSIA